MHKTLLLALAVILAGCVGDPSPEEAVDAEAAPSDETIEPLLVYPGQRVGVLHDGQGAMFTLGFLLASPDNSTWYAASVAHALHMPGQDIPLGTPVKTEQGEIGQFVYDGWSDGQAFEDDFALIELNEAARLGAEPAVAGWGGPVAVAEPDEQLPGWRIFTYGATTADGNAGRLIDEDGGLAMVRLDEPFQPGDSGSPVLSWDGNALGLGIAHLRVEPVEDQSERLGFVVSLDRSLERAAAAGFDLVLQTAAYTAPALPVT